MVVPWLMMKRAFAVMQGCLSQSDPWQTKFNNICQDICNITHYSKPKGRHVLNKEVPKHSYRDKIVSSDTHEGSETDGVYSVNNTPQAADSNHNSGNPELSRSDPWQTKFTNICQEIRNISHQSKIKGKHILNKDIPKIDYRDKIVSLDTHGESETDDAYSVYNILQAAESSRSSGNPEHYDTPIYNTSPTPSSVSPMPASPHMPLLIPGSPILEPSPDVGLRRPCNAALSQSPLLSMTPPGESDQRTEVGVATRGELSWLEHKDSREGQEEEGDPGPGLGEDSSGPSGDLGPSLPPPPNDRKEVTRC